MKPCLFLAWYYQEDQLVHVVGREYFNTGSDILYIKEIHVNSAGHTRDEKLLQLYTILLVLSAGIYVLEALQSSKIHCPGDKSLCMGSQLLFFVKTFGHCCMAYDRYMLK